MKRVSRKIKLGSLTIGGGAVPILQTMITTPLEEYEKACREAERAYEMGCFVVRTAVRNRKEISFLEKLVSRFQGEIIADIHFSYSLALQAVESGVSGVRINPGNIGGREKIFKIIETLKKNKTTALRIGVNSGSLEKDILKKYEGPTVSAMVESVRKWVDFLENELGFMNFKISAKSSDVVDTINIYEKIAAFTDAPFHAGITEAGYGAGGIVKSSAGLGFLLLRGLADTFRVSLTAPLEDEIRTGYHLLRTFGYFSGGVNVISCPTCGRTHGTIFEYCHRLEKWLEEKNSFDKSGLTVAIMGCEVNGPGEASHADLGMAMGNKSALFFKKGKIEKKYNKQEEAFERLLSEILSSWNGGEKNDS